MVNTGAPDFQGFTNWADDPFVFGTFNSSASGVSLGSFNVSQWLGLQCLIQFPAVNVYLRLTYYADAALTQLIGTRMYGDGPGSSTWTTVMVANMGAFVDIALVSAAAQVNAASVTIIPTNRVGPSFASNALGGLLEVSGGNVGANSVLTVNLARIFAGPCHVFVSGMGATGDVQIQWTDPAAINHRWWTTVCPLPAAGLFEAPVMIPPYPCFARFNNTTAGAVTVSMEVAPDSWRVGS